MKQKAIGLLGLLLAASCWLLSAQPPVKLKRKDRKRDVALITTDGTIVLRLYDATPLHRDNFLRLVKSHFYDSILFHRVINHFMIQAGNPASRQVTADQPLPEGSIGYTLPAEFRPELFHQRGVLAAAREGNAVNPDKRSSGSEFYIVQGKTFTDAGLDSVETYWLMGRKLPPEHRIVYKTVGGTPHLDGTYTVFGRVAKGMEVVDAIAATPTSRAPNRDRPLTDVRILRAKLVKRKHYPNPEGNSPIQN